MITSRTYALDSTWRPILKDIGVSSANVLRRAQLPEDLLCHESVRLNAADFYRFWDGIEKELGDPLFPLRLCQAIKTESFSPAVFAALCSPNLWVAAQRISRYKPLVAPMRLDVREHDDTVSITLVWLDQIPKPPTSLVLTELLFFVTLFRTATREHIVPARLLADIGQVPDDAYESYFGTCIRRANVHQIVFKKADALRPFLTSNQGIWATFEPALRARLAELEVSATVTARVQAALLEALPSGIAAMEAVASKLAMSKRTLQRQLEAEETSYLKLLQTTREGLARHYLLNTQIPSAEISFLLGFQESTSFYRAYRNWTGLSPDQIRRPRPAKV